MQRFYPFTLTFSHLCPFQTNKLQSAKIAGNEQVLPTLDMAQRTINEVRRNETNGKTLSPVQHPSLTLSLSCFVVLIASEHARNAWRTEGVWSFCAAQARASCASDAVPLRYAVRVALNLEFRNLEFRHGV